MLIGSCQYSASPLTSIIDSYPDFDKDVLDFRGEDRLGLALVGFGLRDWMNKP
jgi:hypothetical protein